MAQEGDIIFEDLDPQKLELNQILDKIDLCIDAVKLVDDTRVYETLLNFMSKYTDAEIKTQEQLEHIAEVIHRSYEMVHQAINSNVIELQKDIEIKHYSILNDLEKRQSELETSMRNILKPITELSEKTHTLLVSQSKNYIEVVSYKDLPDTLAVEEGQKFIVIKSSFFHLSGIYECVIKKDKKVYIRL